MSDGESDNDAKSVAPKKLPKSRIIMISDDIKPEKKLTTKLMIIDALTELKTRKGVSLYAIKNHLTEKFQVNTEKLNFMIKKTLKTCVEDGTFVQLKGIGASGSFKLAANKVSKPKKKKETEKDEKEVLEKKNKQSEKTMKKMPEKKKIPKTKQKIDEKKLETKTTKKIKEKENSVEEEKEKKKKPKMASVDEKEKKTKVKMVKEHQTPAKKRAAMMKRKSIGSIIKPPKMKPKNK